METWLPIPGRDEGYEVSDAGRVRNKHGRVFKPGNSGGKHGYQMVFLQPGHEKRYVHELVALVFIGPRPEGQQIRHLDSDRFNNAASNLAYGTPSQNSFDTVDAGHHQAASKTHCANNHPFDDSNSYWNGRQRVCRTCRSNRAKAYDERHPGAAAARKRRWRATKA